MKSGGQTFLSDGRKKTRTVEVALGKRSYPIVIGSGARRQFAVLFERRGTGRAFWVTDRNVARHWRSELTQLSDGAGTRLIILPPGEDQKRLATVEKLCRRLAKQGVERGDTLVACGGGVIGDLVGFTAACYLRGIACAQVPTTLLAMVDSSVGGKTGVDLPEGKNLVGAFYQPRFALLDVDFLSTLPRRELISGWAEVIKTAIIGDRELFKQLKRNIGKSSPSEIEILPGILESCVAFKASVVSRDEQEQDRRRILNFGHTVGHALEALGKYEALRHGEAVFWGMSAAVDLSEDFHHLDHQTAAEVRALLRPFLAAIPKIDFDPEKALELISRDKKVRRGTAHLVLIKGIAQAYILDTLTPEQLLAALRKLRYKMRKEGVK